VEEGCWGEATGVLGAEPGVREQVMGGKDSASFSYFRELCVQGFLEARKPENCQVPSLLVSLVVVMLLAVGVPALLRRQPAHHIPHPTPARC
jgi:hypothetical protein